MEDTPNFIRKIVVGDEAADRMKNNYRALYYKCVTQVITPSSKGNVYEMRFLKKSPQEWKESEGF